MYTQHTLLVYFSPSFTLTNSKSCYRHTSTISFSLSVCLCVRVCLCLVECVRVRLCERKWRFESPRAFMCACVCLNSIPNAENLLFFAHSFFLI